MTEPFHFKHRSVFSAGAFAEDVHIIGCGGMGSHVAKSLVRMGVGEKSIIHLWDNDRFEIHNLANQEMIAKHIGAQKVDAMADSLIQINGNCKIATNPHRITKCSQLNGVVFICIDTMKDRMLIVESIERNPNVTVVIETRMDANTGISFCFDPRLQRHIDCWWTYAYSDEEADNLTGCAGPVSIISAILGTTMMALRQFEDYARTKSAQELTNRAYLDFDTLQSSIEIWDSEPDWD